MTVDELLGSAPLFHSNIEGQAHSFQLSAATLKLIAKRAGPQCRSVETGIGYSTVVFAAAGGEHTSIAPDRQEIDRVVTFCHAHGISTAKLSFLCGRSEDVLPSLDVGPLDLVLIDGCHGFPVPFIDWFFLSRAVKPGGVVIVDDTDIWTGDVLRSFLLAESEWDLVFDLPPRASAFTKRIHPYETRDWREQPFVVTETERLARRHYLAKTAALLRAGKWGTAARRGAAVTSRLVTRRSLAK